MNNFIKHILWIAGLALFSLIPMHAQQELTPSVASADKSAVLEKKPWHLKLTVGYQLGAATPFSLPPSIRKIKGWSPLFNPSLGMEWAKKTSHKITLAAGLRLSWKGALVKSQVQHYYTTITTFDDHSEETFQGVFSGDNETRMHNVYITVPIYFMMPVSGTWNVKGGMYTSVLLHGKFNGSVSNGYIRKGDALGEKVIIPHADFDFSKELNSVDYGLLLGVEKSLRKQFFLYSDVSVGLSPLFPKSFQSVDLRLHQVYVEVGGGVKL